MTRATVTARDSQKRQYGHDGRYDRAMAPTATVVVEVVGEVNGYSWLEERTMLVGIQACTIVNALH